MSHLIKCEKMRYLLKLDNSTRTSLLTYTFEREGLHPVCGPCPLNPCGIQAKRYEL